MRTTRSRWLGISIVTFVILVAGITVVWRMTTAAPSWYRPPSERDPAVVRLAEDVEYRIVEEAHRLRADEPWTLRLREHQANAWLATRLPKWIAHEKGAEWDSPLHMAQVRFSGNSIQLAGEFMTTTGRRFLIIQCTPRMEDDGLVLAVTGVSLGRLSIGSGSIERLLDTFAPEQKAELLESELGANLINALEGGALVDPSLKLADARRLQLQGITMHDGAVDLTFVTLEE